MIFAKYCKNNQTSHDYWDNVHEISHHQKVIYCGVIILNEDGLNLNLQIWISKNFSSTFTHCGHKMYRIYPINHGTPNCDRDWSATWVTLGACMWDTCTRVRMLIQSVVCWSHVQVQSCFCITVVWVNNKGYSKKVLKCSNKECSCDCELKTHLIWLSLFDRISFAHFILISVTATHVISTILINRDHSCY